MIFKQLFDTKSSTYSYLLADETSRVAVIIDPVFEQANRDSALIDELGLTLAFAIDTHCHADHVTASWLLQQKWGCKIASAKAIEAENTEVSLSHGDLITFGNEELEVRATPGHTDGCLTFVSHKNRMAFTGDALLIRGCGRCDFQQGSASTLFNSVHSQIFTLPDNYALYPAHDYAGRMATSVKEEKQFNPRLGGFASEHDFVGYMKHMSLPHPKYIDIALPANLKSGKTDPATKLLASEQMWGPLNLTYAGVYEVAADWVYLSRDDIQLLDVRDKEEVEASNIDNAICIPLGELSSRCNELTHNKPIVVLCRSGKRSALAVSMLKSEGFSQVANITGGAIAWQTAGLPIVER